MNLFKHRHSQYEIIILAVRWYCKYSVSYRKLEEILIERGIEVDHTTIYRLAQRYAPEIGARLEWYWRPRSGVSWQAG
jgi:transposase-like protein